MLVSKLSAVLFENCTFRNLAKGTSLLDLTYDTIMSLQVHIAPAELVSIFRIFG